jgi:signal peptidase I
MNSFFEIVRKKGWLPIGAMLLLVVGLRWAIFEAYLIPSGSMLPTLLVNDLVLVNKLVYGVRIPFTEKWLVQFRSPNLGEIVVFKNPKEKSAFLIKRIVGMPGDQLAFENGSLMINNEFVERKVPIGNLEFSNLKDSDLQFDGNSSDVKSNYVHFVESLGEFEHSILIRRGDVYDSFGPVTIPRGQYFVVGDNRNNSSDSRVWGFLPAEYIVGKASFVWISCESLMPIIGGICNPVTLRISRILKRIY